MRLYSVVLSALAVLACAQACRDPRPPADGTAAAHPQQGESAASSSPLMLSDSDRLITRRSLAGVALCTSFDRIDSLFPSARDTVVESEGQSWPGKLVPVRRDEWILFEGSGPDTNQVWRMSTNSPLVHTRKGLHPGSTIGDVLATGDLLSVEYPEGYLIVELVDENIGIMVDDSSAVRFWQRYHYEEGVDPLAVLERSARIAWLIASGSCPDRKAAT
ncbi:MAG: hypothetical protein NTW87_12280 [Planctomycetota bacterium]|nr:hypothetical protein [Planctomycetota bacterium]